MVMLVTLEQASMHLRRDTDDDDSDLSIKIKAASILVIRYLKDAVTFLDSADEVEYDSAGDPLVPEDVQSATLLIIGALYDSRGDNSEADFFEGGKLPPAARALLDTLRKPTMA